MNWFIVAAAPTVLGLLVLIGVGIICVRDTIERRMIERDLREERAVQLMLRQQKDDIWRQLQGHPRDTGIDRG